MIPMRPLALGRHYFKQVYLSPFSLRIMAGLVFAYCDFDERAWSGC